MKKTLTFLLVTTIFYSCKKDTTAEDRNYTISGIHDIRFDNYLSRRMFLSVDPSPGGAKEMVNLSVEGLPKDINAKFSPASGIPGFASELSFEKADSSEGIYNINIVGTSQEGKRMSYPAKISIPELDDIRFDGVQYNLPGVTIYHAPADSLVFDSYRLDLILKMPAGGLPSKAGTYEYGIGPYYDTRPGKIALYLWDKGDLDQPGTAYTTDYNETKRIALKINANGELTGVSLPYIKVSPFGQFRSPEPKTLAIEINLPL